MLYIGNHTTSSKGYEKMAQQMIANGGNTFAFLQEIQEEAMPKPLTRQMWRNFFSLQVTMDLEKSWPMRPIP